MSGPDAGALRGAAAAADAEESGDPVAAAKKPCPNCWIEVKVVTDRQTPYKQERVWLLVDGGGSHVEKLTDARGVARWDDVPEGPRYRVQLVDILEAWPETPPSAGIPKPERFRRQDTTTHDVVPNMVADDQVIVVEHLSEREKFAYFRQTYQENGAYYTQGIAHTHRFETDEPRWHWSKGAVCNEHVNFFLGFWCNYNKDFSYSGGSTCMGALPTFTSAYQKIWYSNHRGYKEFLHAVGPADFDYPHEGLGLDLPYIWVHNHFDAKDGAPLSDLYDRLGEINVYSIADEAGENARRAKALAGITTWLSAHKSHLPAGKTVSQLSQDELWAIAYRVKPGDPDRPKLLEAVRAGALWDHHAGILFKKGDGRLYAFPADSPTRAPIVEKTFASLLQKRKNLWMAIWPLERLRNGGYAPAEAEKNEGKISVDNPPRFIDWSEAVKASSSSKKGGGGKKQK